jgi:hypothetical protein
MSTSILYFGIDDLIKLLVLEFLPFTPKNCDEAMPMSKSMSYTRLPQSLVMSLDLAHERATLAGPGVVNEGQVETQYHRNDNY